jgi:hypothetical protein
VASALACIASGQAASACSFIVPQNPKGSVVGGVTVVGVVFVPTRWLDYLGPQRTQAATCSGLIRASTSAISSSARAAS